MAKSAVDQHKFNGLLIVGDFNYPNLKWNDDYSVEVVGKNISIAAKFINMLNDFSLYQNVNFATFQKANGTTTNTPRFNLVRLIRTNKRT